ncbi:MAG: hypothetical protein KDA70_22515, partial [Planctomycetaceae bacterium]|nr:hypothetical protein [Planctomycetaceae bacterium]
MGIVGYIVGFTDFKSSLSISQVAKLLSSRVFGGIDFIEKDVDEDHDVGTLCLCQDFLGIQVDLFGENGNFTLEIGTLPSASVLEINEVCDLSAMLKQYIDQLGD